MSTTYTKRTLALEYFPDSVCGTRTAVQHLMRWINMSRKASEVFRGLQWR